MEAAALTYAIAAWFTSLLQAGVTGLTFRPFAAGLEVAALAFQARRIVVVREVLAIRAAARGRELLQVPGYRFHAVVTTLTALPEEVWRTYNGRADSENRVKELKRAFGADGFCSRRFSGTEAALRFICLLYNLIGEFQRTLGHATLRTLATLRTTLFACGAILGADGRQPMLRLSRAKPWQVAFLAHLQRLLPTPANCKAVPATEPNV